MKDVKQIQRELTRAARLLDDPDVEGNQRVRLEGVESVLMWVLDNDAALINEAYATAGYGKVAEEFDTQSPVDQTMEMRHE